MSVLAKLQSDRDAINWGHPSDRLQQHLGQIGRQPSMEIRGYRKNISELGLGKHWLSHLWAGYRLCADGRQAKQLMAIKVASFGRGFAIAIAKQMSCSRSFMCKLLAQVGLNFHGID